MKHKLVIIVVSVLFIGGSLALVGYLANSSTAILDTNGIIADQQRDLMLFATALSLVVLIPVYVLLFAFAWRYKEGNNKAAYTPDWDSNKKLEIAWWGIPIIIIAVLSVITWQTSHSLDPYKPIASDKPPITVQVVALQWRWLFIYPDYEIASLNYVQFPEQTPVRFTITGDAPMNTFWIPRLGGMIYAMNGMQSEINLQANSADTFIGSSGNISGKGFAGMRFTARATSQREFDSWVSTMQQQDQQLTWELYQAIAQPSTNTQTVFYRLADNHLYNKVMMQFMEPANANRTPSTSEPVPGNIDDTTPNHNAMENM